MPQPLLDLAGAPGAPLLHLALANGFPPLTYAPFLDPLSAFYRCVCLPPRALWTLPDGSREVRPTRETTTWADLASDLLAGMAQHDLHDVIAVGHSFGGVASAIAATREPERFRALVLLDPTILPPLMLLLVRWGRRLGHEFRTPLVQGALRRRTRFASTEEAFDYFRGKRLFADWPDGAVRLYAESLIPDGAGGLTLAWSNQWEARYFETVYADTWNQLLRHPVLREGRLPVLIVRGGTSDVLTASSFARLRRVLPRATCVEIGGQGHLFPQSAPTQTAQLVRDWLKEALR